MLPTKFNSAEVDLRFDVDNLTVGGQYVQDVGYLDGVFDHIKRLGFDTISLATNVPINIETGSVSVTRKNGDYVGLPRHLWKIADLAEQKGLNTILKLYVVDVENDNPIRKDMKVGNSFSISELFKGIKDYEIPLAIEAGKHGIDGINIGTQQYGFDTFEYKNNWSNIINEIRSVYKGSLIYSGDTQHSAIYSLVDIAAVSIGDEFVSKSRITDAHQIIELYKADNYIQRIQNVYQNYQKPIMIDNVGYYSGNIGLFTLNLWDALTATAVNTEGVKPDYQLQVARYNAYFNIVANYLNSIVQGTTFEQYMPWVDGIKESYDTGRGGKSATEKALLEFGYYGFTLNYQKDAENIISTFINQPLGFRTYFPGGNQDDNFDGTAYDDYFVGSAGNDKINGYLGNDIFLYRSGKTEFNGGGGFDVITIESNREYFFSSPQTSSRFLLQEKAGDFYVKTIDVERVKFLNHNIVALDLDGNAGQAYRLYQAALDRTPDERGLAGWIKFMDEGGSLVAMSQQFIDSQEFKTKYGALDNSKFVNQLYLNVLDRNGEPAGIAGWVSGLANGLTRADVLKGFSESSENQANVIGQIKNGIPYVEWWLA